MTTPADIVNEALQLIGGYNDINPITGSPPTFDGTPVGLAAGIIYQPVVQTVMRQYGWDFSRSVAALTVTSNVAPYGYTYEYLYPPFGVQIGQLVPPTITDANDPRPVNWTVGNAVAPLTPASGYIDFPSNPTDGQSLLLDAVTWTFVAGAAGPFQTHIGGTTAFTIATLRMNLNASADPTISLCTYGNENAGANERLTIDYKADGTAGNAFTLAADAPAVVSGATLTGGTDAQRKAIWTNLQSAQASFTSQPGEDTWDPLFSESVRRLLASELATAIAGKPETSAIRLQEFGAFEKAGEARTDS